MAASALLAASPVAARPDRAGAVTPPPLLVAGIVGTPGSARGLSEAEAFGRYVPGSNVLVRLDGSLLLGGNEPPTPYGLLGGSLAGDERRYAERVRRAVAADRAWLAGGVVPGRTRTERAMAERALLDLRLLTRPDGAVVAAERGYWRYVWPRDGAWVAAALAATGHHSDALRVLSWVADVQEDDGTWHARYHPTGGRPVLDGRAPQLDATGWVPWAAWFWARTQDPDDVAAGAGLERLWPAVSAAADAAAGSLDDRGLPRATPDYWETRVSDVTVATAGALSAGLRAAADLAALRRDVAAQSRWAAAAQRLNRGIEAHFAPSGYRRTPDPASGADAGVAFLAPPFAPYSRDVDAAILDAERRLRTPSGGLRPGENWGSDMSLGWTPATGFAMLAAAASGRPGDADRWLTWMADHRTEVGAIPEKVDAHGRPVSVAPLAWTNALVLLTLVARDEGLPIPPVWPDSP